MIESTDGLVLRTRPLTETSLIVCWLTRDFGRISTVAKGARRPKSPFRGKLDLFYAATLSFRRSRRSELHMLSEVSLQSTSPALRRDLSLLRLACYAAELVETATEPDTPLPGIYELVCEYVRALSGTQHDARIALAFELRLLAELGLSPNSSEFTFAPPLRGLIEQLSVASWDDLPNLQVPKEGLMGAGRFLRSFIGQHLGRVPRSRDAAYSL